MNSNEDVIFYRRIDDRWYVIHGHRGEVYSRSHFRLHGPYFDAREEAIAHAQKLAQRLGIPDANVVEDVRADND